MRIPPDFREKVRVILWGLLKARASDKAAFLITSVRHMLKYTGLMDLRPRTLTIGFGDIEVRFREFTGEVSMFKQLLVDRVYYSLRGFAPEDIEGGCVVDVGANVGIYSLSFARACPACTVYSIEPNPDVYGRLLDNISLNRARNIRPFNMGLSDAPGRAFMQPGESTVLGRLSEVSGGIPGPSPGGMEVQVHTLDDFVLTQGINSIDVLKIDVEGFELKVLKGAVKALEMAKGVVLECESGLRDEVEVLMKQRGFRPAGSIDTYRILYFVRGKE